ncbi:MAG: hypothetical protein LBL04_07900 [Bacteroidales bacterium]|nr:hypothetical protein [Bacteroidales bacterium]
MPVLIKIIKIIVTPKTVVEIHEGFWGITFVEIPFVIKGIPFFEAGSSPDHGSQGPPEKSLRHQFFRIRRKKKPDQKKNFIFVGNLYQYNLIPSKTEGDIHRGFWGRIYLGNSSCDKMDSLFLTLPEKSLRHQFFLNRRKKKNFGSKKTLSLPL